MYDLNSRGTGRLSTKFIAGASSDTKAESGQPGLFLVYPPKWIANGATLVKQLASELSPIQVYSLKRYPNSFLLRLFFFPIFKFHLKILNS